MSSNNKKQEKKKKKLKPFAKMVTGFKKAFKKKKTKKNDKSGAAKNVAAPPLSPNPDLRWDKSMLDVLKVIAVQAQIFMPNQYTSPSFNFFLQLAISKLKNPDGSFCIEVYRESGAKVSQRKPF